MKRNIIFHSVGALCSALIFGVFALPFYTITVSPEEIASGAAGMGVPVGSTSGYSFLKTALKETDGTALAKFTTIIALVTLILAGLAFLTSVFMLLHDLNIVKSEKVAKIARWIALCSAVLLALSCILNLIGNACFVKNDLQDRLALAKTGLAALGASISTSAGWTLTVIATVLGLGTAGTSVAAKYKK